METPVWSYTASNLGSNDTVTKCRLGRQQSAGSQDLTAFLSNFNRWFFQIVSNSLNKWTAIIWRHFSSNLLIFRTIRARTNHRTKLIGAAFDLLKTPPCSLSRNPQWIFTGDSSAEDTLKMSTLIPGAERTAICSKDRSLLKKIRHEVHAEVRSTLNRKIQTKKSLPSKLKILSWPISWSFQLDTIKALESFDARFMLDLHSKWLFLCFLWPCLPGGLRLRTPQALIEDL